MSIKSGCLIFLKLCLFYILSTYLINIPLHAQNNSTYYSDSILAEKYYAIAENKSFQAEYDSSNYYYSKAGNIYKSINCWTMYVVCKNYTGWNYYEAGNFDLAEKLYYEAIQISHKNILEDKWLAHSYMCLGTLYHEKQMFLKSLDFYEKALNIYFEKKHIEALAACYGNMGVVYCDKGDYFNALEFHKMELMLYTKIYGEGNINLAICFNNLGVNYNRMKSYDIALEYFQTSLQIRLNNLKENHPDVATSYMNMGSTMINLKNYQEAKGFIEKALKTRIEFLGEKHPRVGTCYLNLGDIFLNLNKSDTALIYFNKSYEIYYNAFNGFHGEVALNCLGLSQSFLQKQEYKKAIEWNQKAFHALVKGFKSDDIYSNPVIDFKDKTYEDKINSKLTLLMVLVAKADLLETIWDLQMQ